MYRLRARISVPKAYSEIIEVNENVASLIEDILVNALKAKFGTALIEHVDIIPSPSPYDTLNILLTIDILHSNNDKLTTSTLEDLSLEIENIISQTLLELFWKISVEKISIEDITAKVVDAEIVIPDSITIRITEEPLTAQNFATIISALTELYTKCWLMVQQQFAELIRFTQTHDNRLTKEANLIITRLSYNSPAEIKLETGFGKDIGEGLKLAMEALKIGIDALVQAPLRFKDATLENQLKESEIKLKELESKSTLADQEQSRQIAAQKTEQDYQMFLLEQERKRLELLEKRLDIEKKRIEYALEIANKIVSVTNPDIHPEVRNMLIQTLIPNILQLGSSNGLELATITLKKEDY